jgi:DeoR/GlpR family transcriptional regulator of sugar metabolism
MFQIERQERILQYINEKGKANIKELSDAFNVSKITIRRDLDELAQRNLIIKTHGGVMSLENNFLYEIPYESKSGVNMEAKSKIGKAAAQLIEPNDVIILDAGSTTLQMVKNINKNNVTIITNDIKIAMEVAHKSGLKLIVGGGIREESVYTLIGPTTEEFFLNVHVNKTFLGCDAISLEYGITNRTMQEVPIKRAMMKAAEEVIAVADHSKLDKKVFSFLCQIKEINKLVIDKVEEDFKKSLNDIGVEVIVAD